MHSAYESPRKDRSPRMFMCLSLCVCVHTHVSIDVQTCTHKQVVAGGKETLCGLQRWRTPLVTFTAVMLLITAFIDTPTSGAACDDDTHTTHTHTQTVKYVY